jgi:hypothetical protein
VPGSIAVINVSQTLVLALSSCIDKSVSVVECFACARKRALTVCASVGRGLGMCVCVCVRERERVCVCVYEARGRPC